MNWQHATPESSPENRQTQLQFCRLFGHPAFALVRAILRGRLPSTEWPSDGAASMQRRHRVLADPLVGSSFLPVAKAVASNIGRWRVLDAWSGHGAGRAALLGDR
jgi:hypothetical protein